MRDIFFILLCVFLFSSPTLAKTIRTFKPLVPMQIPTISQPKTIQQGEFISSESYPKITLLEQNLFKRSYERENIYNRLSRIEKNLFRREFSSLSLSSRVDNIFNNIDVGIIHGIKSREISKLESKVLGRIYPNDDTESRITRLEKEMLGAMQGGNLNERFQTLKIASKHYNSFPEIVNSQHPYQMPFYGYGGYAPTYNHNNGWNSNWNTVNNGWNSNPSIGIAGILRNMAKNVFGRGVMTGFTPSVYDPYSSYPMNSGSGEQEYCWGNTGGYFRNRNLGGGSTVRILD